MLSVYVKMMRIVPYIENTKDPFTEHEITFVRNERGCKYFEQSKLVHCASWDHVSNSIVQIIGYLLLFRPELCPKEKSTSKVRNALDKLIAQKGVPDISFEELFESIDRAYSKDKEGIERFEALLSLFAFSKPSDAEEKTIDSLKSNFVFAHRARNSFVHRSGSMKTEHQPDVDKPIDGPMMYKYIVNSDTTLEFVKNSYTYLNVSARSGIKNT